MNPFLVAPGIRFDDYVFSEPRPLIEVAVPKCCGLLVVLIRDPNWSPKPFQPLCFQEFGNNARENFLAFDPIRLARTRQADTLFMSVLAMPYSTAAQRRDMRNQLARAYNPFCQARIPVQSELVDKLDELERKNEEQTMQVRLLLTSLNRLFEPQPEPRRRHIGFLPESTAV